MVCKGITPKVQFSCVSFLTVIDLHLIFLKNDYLKTFGTVHFFNVILCMCKTFQQIHVCIFFLVFNCSVTRLFDRNSCGLEKCEMNCVSLFDEHMSCDSTTCRAKYFLRMYLA